ncbi:MAG: Hpt domain-containing protein [Spirochaetaceae bacterium]
MITNPEFQKKILASFQLEVEVVLKQLKSGLSTIESSIPNHNKSELLIILHRNCHSLKGAAQSVGFYQIQILSQALEDLFSRLKEDKICLVKENFKSIYRALDIIEALSYSKDELVIEGLTDLIGVINKF